MQLFMLTRLLTRVLAADDILIVSSLAISMRSAGTGVALVLVEVIVVLVMVVFVSMLVLVMRVGVVGIVALGRCTGTAQTSCPQPTIVINSSTILHCSMVYEQTLSENNLNIYSVYIYIYDKLVELVVSNFQLKSFSYE